MCMSGHHAHQQPPRSACAAAGGCLEVLLDLKVQIPLRDHLLPQRRVQPGALARAVQPAQVDKQRESGEFARAFQRRQPKGIRLASRPESVCTEDEKENVLPRQDGIPSRPKPVQNSQARETHRPKRSSRVSNAACATSCRSASDHPKSLRTPSATAATCRHTQPSRPSGNHACRFRIVGPELVLCVRLVIYRGLPAFREAVHDALEANRHVHPLLKTQKH